VSASHRNIHRLILTDAIQVILRYESGDSVNAIAEGYDVSPAMIRRILSGALFPEAKRLALLNPFDPEWRSP
jgi:hypothetical protein